MHQFISKSCLVFLQAFIVVYILTVSDYSVATSLSSWQLVFVVNHWILVDVALMLWCNVLRHRLFFRRESEVLRLGPDDLIHVEPVSFEAKLIHLLHC